MKGLRGAAVLGLAVVVGLVAAKAASVYVGGAKVKEEKPPAVVEDIKSFAPPPGFADAIPEGMRAVSVRVDEVSGVSQKIAKGDFVDILATSTNTASGEESVTRLILEAVEVLDTTTDGAARGREKTKAERDWIVTLLVRPEEGASLIAAASQARLSLLARCKSDEETPGLPDAAFSRQDGFRQPATASSNPVDRIRPGMRAVTLEVRDTDGISGRLGRGDRVDVIATSPFSRFASSGDTPGATGNVTEFRMRSITLLQDVEVLAATGDGHAGADGRVARVTLQLTPQDAEKVAVTSDATNKSVLRLVSRNPRDREKAVTAGQDLAEILTEKREFYRVSVYKGLKAFEKPLFTEFPGKTARRERE